MSELADETDSKSVIRKGVWVQVPPPAPKIREHYTNNVLLFLYVVMNETANGYVGSEPF